MPMKIPKAVASTTPTTETIKVLVAPTVKAYRKVSDDS